jgi:pimeloyl-ACP methyl ester carboxylesterase
MRTTTTPFSDRRPVDRPPWYLRLYEASWPLELAALTATRRLPSAMLPAGDGHPVLVLPGFTASDRSTWPLRRMLADHGYATHGWGLGRNLGPFEHIVTGLRARVDDLYRSEGRPVTLVGWSLGGIYARQLARERPAQVRRVITLGSPYRMLPGDGSSATPLWERLEPYHDSGLDLAGLDEAEREPLTVPATSIYTRTDGVVHWTLCIDATGPSAPNRRSENIEVYGTHLGLGVNPAVVYAVLDRLAQPVDNWSAFSAPRALRPWYPPPKAWSRQRSHAA